MYKVFALSLSREHNKAKKAKGGGPELRPSEKATNNESTKAN
jgi:hypothetical protein